MEDNGPPLWRPTETNLARTRRTWHASGTRRHTRGFTRKREAIAWVGGTRACSRGHTHASAHATRCEQSARTRYKRAR